jgi:hypothetical protein
MPHGHHKHEHHDHVHAVTLTGTTAKGDAVTLTGQTGGATPLPAAPPADASVQAATTSGRGHGGHGHGGRGFVLAPLCSDCPNCVPCREAARISGAADTTKSDLYQAAFTQKDTLLAAWESSSTKEKAFPIVTAASIGVALFGAMTDRPWLAFWFGTVAAYSATQFGFSLGARFGALTVGKAVMSSVPTNLPAATTPTPALPPGTTTAGWPMYVRR